MLAAIARRLRAVRLAHGARKGIRDYKVAAFAEELGLKIERLSRYERGERSAPIPVLVKIHEVTGVSLDVLLGAATRSPHEMILPQGLADGEYSVGERLAMVRKVLEPSIAKAATAMEVSVETWSLWEAGAEIPPISTMIEFCRQFGDIHRLGLDFLYRGILTGIAAPMAKELLRLHPRLAQGSAIRTVMPSGHRSRNLSGNNGQ
jgi:transcriptional regulator with XRE-family HTH domain